MTDSNQSPSDVAIMNNDGDNRYRDKNKKFKKLFFEYSGLLPFFIFSILFIYIGEYILLTLDFKFMAFF